MSKRWWGVGVLLAVGWVAGGCSGRGAMSALRVPRQGVELGSRECPSCHGNEAALKAFSSTIHGRLADFEAPFQTKGCKGCHGGGSLHVLSGKDSTAIVRFQELPSEESSGICLRCHTQNPLMDWYGSAHPQGGLACADCHQIHGPAPARGLLRKAEPDLCYDCHPEKRAQGNYPSHHPIREGKMGCSDCHEVHGSGDKGLKESTVNELCFRCHGEKEGPFTFEHAAVSEGCTVCHDPHGTMADHLKRQNEPFLCLQCHTGHRDQRRPTLDRPEYRATFFTKCSTCHAEVHGTDILSPSDL